MSETNPRLHIILAREANRAIAIRRGPTDWFRLSLWHTDRDEFEHGQWFKGKIFPYRSDISPDGTLFIYFAAKYAGAPGRFGLDYCDTWTAISKPPYFTALTLWPSTMGTWMGGGLFERNRRLWLNFVPGLSTTPHPDFPLPKKFRVTAAADRLPGDMPIYAQRLQRDGWTLQPAGSYATSDWQWGKDWCWGKALMWHKPHGDFTLMMEWLDEEYNFALLRGDDETLLNGISWADWDQQGRLVGVSNGQVVMMNPVAPNEDRLVVEDFNDQTPDPQSAPSWAKRW